MEIGHRQQHNGISRHHVHSVVSGTTSSSEAPSSPHAVSPRAAHSSQAPASPIDLYERIRERGTRPTLTWYGTDGRIELSGKVVANHLAKIAGYLADDVWVEPGDRVILHLPGHWKTVLWGLGALLAGAQVVISAERMIGEHTALVATGEDRDAIVIADRLDVSGSSREFLALDLSPLARGWSGDALPAGVRDAAAEVMGAPDVLLIDPEASGESNYADWIHDGAPHIEVTPRAANREPGTSPERFLVAAATPLEALARASYWLGRGGLVVVDTCTGDNGHVQFSESTISAIAEAENAKIAHSATK
ncbi:hypothetical protein I6E29_01395 [Arcanobacterium haemolyticum]|nr:hypothetical protein [Arcanobacterium haemolyticum]